jgi:hypothetical protein
MKYPCTCQPTSDADISMVNEMCPQHGTVTPTGRLVTRQPETQLVPHRERALTPPQQEMRELLMRHVDTRDLEQRLRDTYLGRFVGAAYDEDELPEVHERRIILTDED